MLLSYFRHPHFYNANFSQEGSTKYTKNMNIQYNPNFYFEILTFNVSCVLSLDGLQQSRGEIDPSGDSGRKLVMKALSKYLFIETVDFDESDLIYIDDFSFEPLRNKSYL